MKIERATSIIDLDGIEKYLKACDMCGKDVYLREEQRACDVCRAKRVKKQPELGRAKYRASAKGGYIR